jgi:hypothetical protein
MNAVERLLAHGEQLLSLFDEMYREPDPGDWAYATFLEPSAETVPLAFRSEPWVSFYWWQAAVGMAAHDKNIIDRASSLLRDRLSQRQRLLDRTTWQQLVADVVRDCRAWDFLAKKVVRLSQTIADSAIFIEEQMEQWSCRGDWQATRNFPHRNLGLLRRIAQPPAPAGSTSEEQTNSNRSRVGRPPNDEALARDLLNGWRAYEPEEGLKTIDRYLAQRADVRAIKTAEARQRKIVSLRTALESAQSLHRSKARQKRRARG